MKFRLGNTKASRLTGERVMEIREKWASGRFTQARLAREYLVSINTIRNVIYGVTWQHLPMVPMAGEFEAGRTSRDEVVPMSKELEAKLIADLAKNISPPADPIEEFMKSKQQEKDK